MIKTDVILSVLNLNDSNLPFEEIGTSRQPGVFRIYLGNRHGGRAARSGIIHQGVKSILTDMQQNGAITSFEENRNIEQKIARVAVVRCS